MDLLFETSNNVTSARNPMAGGVCMAMVLTWIKESQLLKDRDIDPDELKNKLTGNNLHLIAIRHYSLKVREAYAKGKLSEKVSEKEYATLSKKHFWKLYEKSGVKFESPDHRKVPDHRKAHVPDKLEADVKRKADQEAVDVNSDFLDTFSLQAKPNTGVGVDGFVTELDASYFNALSQGYYLLTINKPEKRGGHALGLRIEAWTKDQPSWALGQCEFLDPNFGLYVGKSGSFGTDVAQFIDEKYGEKYMAGTFTLEELTLG